MKKLIMIVVSSFLLFLVPMNFQATAATKPVIGVSTVYTDKTGTVNLAVFIESDQRIAAGSFDIVYDPLLLTVRDKVVKEGTTLSTQLKSINSAEPGKIGVSWAQLDGVMMKGTVIEFPATVTRDGAGATITLSLTNVHLYDAQGKEIAVQALSGEVKPFNGSVEERKEAVSNDHEFKIRLSTAYNDATLNASTVVVKRGNVVVDVVLTRVNADTFSVKPVTTFARGKHTIEITDQLYSAQGSKLNQPVRYEFTVK